MGEICRKEPLLFLSTGHLTWATCRLLEETPLDSVAYPACGGPIPYGFFLHAPEERVDDTIPDDLWACMEFAQAQGCSYIRFDCDESLIDALPDHSFTHPGCAPASEEAA
jgi:hypothetical protein